MVPRASGPVFMFCAPVLIFGGSKGVGSLFHVLRAQTRFRRYRGRRVPFSCFAHQDAFSAVPRASGPVFLFCFPDSLSSVPRETGHVFLFCARRLVFGGTEGVGSRFLVLHVRTRFRRYRGRLFSFLCSARPDSFSAVPRATGLVFIFCAPGLVFGGNEGVVSRFHVLRSQNNFRRYRGRRVPLSCFARPNSYLAVQRSSGPFLMFCAPVLVFNGTEGVGSRFHVFCARTHFRR
jgi:hypothetical protein